MRSDMAKVIVERPRYGSRIHGKAKGARKRVGKPGFENLPKREGIKRSCRGGTKQLNEHLGPLRRYLQAQVGRPWNKVFSEICTHISRDSAVQDHVRDHVFDYVATNVMLIDGVPCSGEGDRLYGKPLMSWFRRTSFYVCPVSGILKRVKRLAKPQGGNRPAKVAPTFIKLGKFQQLRLIDGAWHLVNLKAFPEMPAFSTDRDILLDRPVANMDRAQVVETYGAARYATALRRLTREELKSYPIPIDLLK
jgi:hypothetical protein